MCTLQIRILVYVEKTNKSVFIARDTPMTGLGSWRMLRTPCLVYDRVHTVQTKYETWDHGKEPRHDHRRSLSQDIQTTSKDPESENLKPT